VPFLHLREIRLAESGPRDLKCKSGSDGMKVITHEMKAGSSDLANEEPYSSPKYVHHVKGITASMNERAHE
jgi:hypothetical protein